MSVTFTLEGIIQSIDNQLYCYDTTYRTYQEAITFTTAELDLIAVFKCVNESTTSYKFVDVIKILKQYSTNPEYLLYNVTNWTELTQFVTDMYNITAQGMSKGELLSRYLTYSPVPRYQHYYKVIDGFRSDSTRITPFTSNLTDYIRIVSLGYSDSIEGSYVNKDFPKVRNLSNRRVSMPDLVFSKKKHNTMDFSSTIPSIDGIVCYPIYSKDTDELYACNGARMLKNTTDSNSLNILLMDFSNLGDVTHYKLSECSNEMLVKCGENVWIFDSINHVAVNELSSKVEYWQDCMFTIKFRLPIGVPHGMPIISIAGRMFFKGIDDIVTYSESGYEVIEFQIHYSVLENIIASNLQHQNLFFKKSSLFRVVLSYVLSNLFVDQAYEYDKGTDEWIALQFNMDQIIPFISIISTTKKYGIDKIEPMTALRTGKLVFPKDAKGLLMNLDTREFIDYTKIPYKDQTLVTFSIQHPLYITKREGGNTNGDPLYSQAVSYDDVVVGAPDTLVLNYINSDHKFKLIDPAREIYAESIAQPYETEGGGSTRFKSYTWNEISEGVITLYPSFNPSTKNWYLEHDGLCYAESEADTNTVNNFQWSYGTSMISYSQLKTNVSPTLTQITYDTYLHRQAIVDRKRNVLAISEETTSTADPALLDWFYVGDTTEYTYSTILAAVREKQFYNLNRIFSNTTRTWSLIDNQTRLLISTSEVVNTYSALNWMKVLQYDTVNWYRVVDGTNVVSDNVRLDRMGWQDDPVTFTDPYNKYAAGEFIKTPRHYALLDINIYKEETGSFNLLDDVDNPIKQADKKTDNPEIPVLTAEHETVKDSILIKSGTAPKPTANIKVTPTIVGSTYSTSNINVNNCGAISSVTADGLFSNTKNYYTRKMVNNEYVYTQVVFNCSVGDVIGSNSVYEKDIYSLTSDTNYIKGKTYYYSESGEYKSFTINNAIGDAIVAFPIYIKDYNNEYHITPDRVFKYGIRYYNRFGQGVPEDPYVYKELRIGGNPVTEVLNEYYAYKLTTDSIYAANKCYYTRTGNGTEEIPYVYTNLPVLNGKVALDTYFERGHFAVYDGIYTLVVNPGESAETGIYRVWSKNNGTQTIKHESSFALTSDARFKTRKTYYTKEGSKYQVAIVQVGAEIEPYRYYEMTIGYWTIKSGNTEVFKTDRAEGGSAPYNSQLQWRLA